LARTFHMRWLLVLWWTNTGQVPVPTRLGEAIDPRGTEAMSAHQQ
jgi:hypothetical protein